MTAIRMGAGLLLLGATVVVGCNDRSTPTALRHRPAPAFDVTTSLTSLVTDPLGDAAWNQNTGPGSAKKVPDYLDITRAEIAMQGRTFVLTMNVADVVPANPTEASGGVDATQVWIWGLDTDPAAFPEGDPFSSGTSYASEFFLDVEWDGTHFSGLPYDRRPLLTGGVMVVSPVPFTIEGAQLQVSIAASPLGDPSTFGWAAATCTRHAHLGSNGFQCLDHAPDIGLATWPQ